MPRARQPMLSVQVWACGRRASGAPRRQVDARRAELRTPIWDINPMSSSGGSDPLAVPRCAKRQKLVENSSRGTATAGGGCSEVLCDLAVPKCVSMWKNKKGYLVPIGTRMHKSARDSVAVNVDKFRHKMVEKELEGDALVGTIFNDMEKKLRELESRINELGAVIEDVDKLLQENSFDEEPQQ
ncbi:UNVERIFIED_CONTAM: hypothetical protein PYX00_011495 [Menopon gallinae]|uniref:SKI-interacting protein SKIP SNW domain-containing protein n=1 Tax=Menopon gallinae TaxID=328185 RepID=A0AAW2H7S0_9NEOP